MAASTALQVLVSPLLGTVFDSLRSVIEAEFSQISGVGEEFERLSDILSTIQDVLEDAEVKQLKDKPIRNWLRKLKDVAYDVEDFLDECMTAQDNQYYSRRFHHIQEFLTGSVPSLLSFEPSSSSSHTIAEKIERFIRKFDAIAEQRYKFHLNPYVAVADPQSRVKQLRETTSKLINEQQIYGRDQDTINIVNQLLKHISEGGAGDVLVYPIVGLGGLGKTTLAQMIYKEDKIVDQYQIRSWVCVSENFDLKVLFKAIIQSCGESVQDLQSLDLIQSRLEDILDGNRFLIVLDDVWNEDQAEWEILKSSLSCGAKGSSILVTTRLATVASIMSTVPPYYPGTLSHENCWSLFKHRAFSSGNEETMYPKLEKIGLEIVKKCGGIPLAAKALGGLLRFKRDEKQWLFVKNSEIWELEDNASDAILPALRLSYNNLPSNSKQCFVFCSMFPKNHKFVKEELIYLWMANGFLHSKGGIMEPEDIGDEIFSDLCMRSFFQEFEKDEQGNTTVCKMHDLVHDLACSTMRGECSILREDDAKGKAMCRPSSCSTTTHLSLVDNPLLPKTSPRMRTLVRLRVKNVFNESTSSLESIFSYLKCLRVLDLRNTDISEIPNSIGTMKHLRYLNLSFTKIQSLPNEYFCGLINLQILKLASCSHLTSLPRNMSKMINLRHLDIQGCNNLAQMPPGMGKLIFLRTLSVFIVGNGTRNGCGIGELKDLNHLKGNLMIKGLELIKTPTDASSSHLIEKQDLQSLELCWSWFSGAESEEAREEGVLMMIGEGLQPHENLTKLSIQGYRCENFPHWIGAKVALCLPNLVELSLFNCYRCQYLPPLGELPMLKFLQIYDMDSVKCISKEFYQHGIQRFNSDGVICSFPSLEELDIHDMLNLEEFSLPASLSPSAYPCLRTLRIKNCPKLRIFFSLPSSIEELDLEESHEMVVLKSLENLPSRLSHLKIKTFPNLVSFPAIVEEELESLSNLLYLQIWECPKLKALPKKFIKSLTSLTDFMISDCHELTQLPEGMHNINSLKLLWIEHCGSLMSLNRGLRNLTKLQNLRICSCPKLKFFPDDFENLSSLRKLNLEGLPKVTELPALVIGGSASSSHQPIRTALPTLKDMTIRYCSGLTRLPEWISYLQLLEALEVSYCKNLQFLPDEGLQRLTALDDLRIMNCHPDLHRRCDKDVGEYWDKIAHIKRLLVYRDVDEDSTIKRIDNWLKAQHYHG